MSVPRAKVATGEKHVHVYYANELLRRNTLQQGPQYRPQYTIVLIMGTLNRVSLILGNPHIGDLIFRSSQGSGMFSEMLTAGMMPNQNSYGYHYLDPKSMSNNAFMVVIMGLGLLSYVLLGFRYGLLDLKGTLA